MTDSDKPALLCLSQQQNKAFFLKLYQQKLMSDASSACVTVIHSGFSVS